MPSTKLTAGSVKDAKGSGVAGKQVLYWDQEMKGFGLRVSTSRQNGLTKTYIAERRIRGKTKRRTVGRHPELSAQQARKEAQSILAEMGRGIDPRAKNAAEANCSTTLKTVWSAYLDARTLKPNTLRSYERAIRIDYSDWHDKPWTAISSDMVISRFKKIGDRSGRATANASMRVLRTVLNFAMAKYRNADGTPMVPENPVDRLGHLKMWHSLKRRTRLIPDAKLGEWFMACRKLDNPVASDYLITLLLTGLRKEEAANLKCDNVCFNEGVLRLSDTKNGDELALPLSNTVRSILSRRIKQSEQRGWEYVFPATKPDRPICDIRKQVAKLEHMTGVYATPHDLRRTFATIADAVGTPQLALKALLNHRTNGGDVTGGYVQMTPQRLMEPMQKITDKVLDAANLTATQV